MLDPASPPEGDRRGALAVPRRRDAPGDGRTGRRARQGGELPVGGHGRVRRRSRPELLLPRDEHAAAGRASGDRDDHRPRSGRADDPRSPPARSCRSRRRTCRLNGWAIECRINAEDPFRNFLPSIGRLVQVPAARPRFLECVRVDTGVYEGGEISMYYDSMIAKLITHGATRDMAIARMRDALNAFVIRGVSTNISFQAALMQHPRFVSGRMHTGLIAEEYPKGFRCRRRAPRRSGAARVRRRVDPSPLHGARRGHHRSAARPRVQGRQGLDRGPGGVRPTPSTWRACPADT